MKTRGFGLVVAFAVLLAGCQTMVAPPPPPPSPVMIPPPPPPPLPVIQPRPVTKAVPLKKANYTRVPVFYGTNRARLSGTALEGRFANASGPGVIYGALEVTIPLVHQVGEVERPGIFYGLFFDPDPKKHFTIAYNSEMGRAAFFAKVRESLRYKAGGRRKQALVFVHGFNVAFDDAAFRTAQISHDMKFKGTPLFYSWPSANALLSYGSDSSRIEESRGYIKTFFADVATQTGADDIYIIAHSMGTRGVSEALKELALEKPALAGRFRALLLGAPDINKKVFVNDIAPTLRRFIPNMTVYASAQDKALLLSKGIIWDAARLGDTNDGVAVVNGVTSIDASAAKMSFLGHSEYGDSPALLRDMAGVIAGKTPAQRPGLRRRNAAPLPYYVLTP